ncbi:MAG: ribokinase [Alphaproteobacteria bacterium]|nr:ribokinase [Alphaproteobacteria bacterium]
MITVFGSINVDLVMHVDSLPLPGETTLCPDYLVIPGGKGANQALAARRAGATVRMIGCVGQDDFAGRALSLMRDEAVDLSGLATSEKPTCCAAVCVDSHGENAIVVASGANRDAAATQIADGMLEPGDWLVLQMEIPHEENWNAVRMAKAAGAKVMLSVAPAAPVPEPILEMLDVLLVNRIEGDMVASHIGFAAQDSSSLPTALSETFGLTCVMTLGGEGAAAVGPGLALSVPTLPVSVIDTTGAGDAFAGVLAAALDEGLPIHDALRHASTAAGLACTVMGAQTGLPAKDAIEAALPDLPPMRPLEIKS